MLYFYENRFPYIHSFEENENILHIPLPNYFSDQVGFIDDFPEENNTNIYIPNASLVVTENESIKPNISYVIDHSTLRRSTDPLGRVILTYLHDFQTIFYFCDTNKVKYSIKSFVSLTILSPSFKQVIISIDANSELEL